MSDVVNIYNDITKYYIWKIWPYQQIRSIPSGSAPELNDAIRFSDYIRCASNVLLVKRLGRYSNDNWFGRVNALAGVLFPINIILLHISTLNLTVFVNEVLSTICFANFCNKYFQVCHFLFKETFSNTSIHPSKVF